MKKCLKCGAENADTSVFCAGCGAALDQQAPAPAPSSYDVPVNTPAAAPVEKNKATLWLILNICSTVLCCAGIFGILGIIFAAIGMGSYNKGDYADMSKKSKLSMIMFIIGMILGIISLIIIIVLMATGALASIFSSYNSYY